MRHKITRALVGGLIILSLLISIVGCATQATPTPVPTITTTAPPTTITTTAPPTTVTATPSPTTAPKVIVWTMEHSIVMRGAEFDTIMARDMPNWISQATNGGVQVKLIEGVIPSKESLPSVAKGTVQMGITWTGYWPEIPMITIGELPMLIKQNPKMHQKLWEVGSTYYVDALAEKGVSLKFVFSPIMQGFWATKPIAQVSDFAGLKLRAPSVSSRDFQNIVGASPVTMTFSEVVAAIGQGVVNGANMDLEAGGVVGMSNYVKNFSFWPTAGPYYVLYVNPQAWKDLPAEYQKALDAMFAAKQVEIWARLAVGQQRAIENAKKLGVTLTYPSDAAFAQARTMVAPLYDQWATSAGPKGREFLNKVLAFAPDYAEY